MTSLPLFHHDLACGCGLNEVTQSASRTLLLFAQNFPVTFGGGWSV